MDRRAFLQIALSLPLGPALAGRGEASTAPSSRPESTAPTTAAETFVHLRVHTGYSIGESIIRIDELARRVRELGMPAVAITDRGNLFGAPGFYRSCIAHGVKPILGCDVSIAGETRPGGGPDVRLTLLAMNGEGYRNLCRLLSTEDPGNLRRLPRIDHRHLERLNPGLIVLWGSVGIRPAWKPLGAMAGEIPRSIIEQAAIFEDRFYLAIERRGIEERPSAIRALVREAGRLGVSVAAVSDCRFLDPADAAAYETLLRIPGRRSGRLADLEASGARAAWVKSPKEMQEAFAEVPEAVANTVAIAARCNVELRFGRRLFPLFPTPSGERPESCLAMRATDGLSERLESLRKTPDWEARREAVYRERLSNELDTIERMGFADYFLVVADFVSWMRDREIALGPGRGSAPGSLVAWCLGITEIDPLAHGLHFERLVNPARKMIPDIDVECCAERRDEVFAYLRGRYRADRVAGLVTFSTWRGRPLIREAGRALGLSQAAAHRIAARYPEPPDRPSPRVSEALEKEPALRALCERNGTAREILSRATLLETLPRDVARHASAVVISPRPLTEDVPLLLEPDGNVLTQYDYRDADALGLVNFDFLRSGTLTLMNRTLARIRETGRPVDLRALPLDDRETFELLSRGDTARVAFLESEGARKLLRQVRPERLVDIASMIALDRPGPLEDGLVDRFLDARYGRKKIRHPHPLVEPILRETYGVLLFQEQMMSIACAVTGCSLGEADTLRRAMGKGRAEELNRLRADFRERASRRGIGATVAAAIFDSMDWASMLFNKSHAIGFALTVYRMAYLKTHYPREVAAALEKTGDSTTQTHEWPL